jgi:hypothetical protein
MKSKNLFANLRTLAPTIVANLAQENDYGYGILRQDREF